MEEIWKSVPGWPGYEVSNLGRVRSYKKRKGLYWVIAKDPQRILRPCMSAGYRAVYLSRGGSKEIHRIARLVLEAFVGPKPNGMEICHKDCVKTNDWLSNLRYDTRQGNLHDGVGPGVAGRLTNEEAVKVKQLASTGYSDKQLAQRFDVSELSISRCRLGHSYAYTKGPLTNHRRQLGDAQVREMRIEGSTGINIVKLASRYDVDPSYVSLVLRGLRRKLADGPISAKRYDRDS